MTRAELAARVHVAEETIRRWERGGSRPSEASLARLIVVLALDGGALARQSGNSDDELPPLARRLRHERADRHITQTEAAELIGVAQPTYAGWEVGRSSPEVAHHASVADFLGVAAGQVAELTAVPLVVDSREWPELGRLLGRRREALRLTRGELARRLGVTPTTIMNWELGYRTPRVQQLRSLAAVLEVSVHELEAALPGTDRPLSGLAEMVQDRQAQLGLTRAEIARRAGTDEATLSRWIHGHRRPDTARLRRLARVLRVPPATLSEVITVR